MQRHQYWYDSNFEIAIRCMSCKKEYQIREGITCRKCYREATALKNELKGEIEDLTAKVAFLGFRQPPHDAHRDSAWSPAHFFRPDVVLVAHGPDDSLGSASETIPAHQAILGSRSPVFKAMLESDMEESKSGTIKINDASNDALRALVSYLYTAEAPLTDEQMGCDLLVLAEKYMVKHLKAYCEKFLVSKLDWENSLMSYAFAHQHNAKLLLDAALSLIIDNMDKLAQRGEYKELVEKDPRLLVEIYEAYLFKQVNIAKRLQQ